MCNERLIGVVLVMVYYTGKLVVVAGCGWRLMSVVAGMT